MLKTLGTAIVWAFAFAIASLIVNFVIGFVLVAIPVLGTFVRALITWPHRAMLIGTSDVYAFGIGLAVMAVSVVLLGMIFRR